MHHAQAWNHLDSADLRSAVGEVAVIVFFVLSGFLITSLL